MINDIEEMNGVYIKINKYNIESIRITHCNRTSCLDCVLASKRNKTGLECEEFCARFIDTALQLMGYEVLEVTDDMPIQTEHEKPLADWTLQEVKDICENNSGCKNCEFYSIENAGCSFYLLPNGWDLQPKPSWAEQDIEFAKAIKLLYPWAEFIIIYSEEIIVAEDFVVTPGVKRVDIQRNNNIFADLNFGTAYKIDVILADGQNSANGQNKED